jgi:hypothetical protein
MAPTATLAGPATDVGTVRGLDDLKAVRDDRNGGGRRRLPQADLQFDSSESARLATVRNPTSVTFPFAALCMSFCATCLRLSWSPP